MGAGDVYQRLKYLGYGLFRLPVTNHNYAIYMPKKGVENMVRLRRSVLSVPGSSEKMPAENHQGGTG